MAGADSSLTGPLVKVSKTGQALGTKVVISVFHRDSAAAKRALAEAFEAIEQVEQVMSLYRPESQLSQLNLHGYLADPHPFLREVLERAIRLSKQTSGAFDISVQPLWAAYEAASKEGRLPTRSEIASARRKVDWQRIELSPERVAFGQKGMALTLNGIAQGYAADAASKALRARGIQQALIDSGEISSVGTPVQKDRWTIGIKHPRETEAFIGFAGLQGRCLATSGDYETVFTDDFDHHHLLDPHTGRSPSQLSSVAIAAPTAMEADALSTAVFVMGLERGKAFVDRLPNVDALFVDKSSRTTRTSNFPLV